MSESKAGAEPRGPWLVTTYVVLSLVALSAVHLIEREADLLSKAAAELESLAEVKAARIADWQGERLSDGRSISAHPLIGRLVRQVERGRDPELARADLRAWCRSRMQHQEYLGVALFGSKGDLLVADGIESDERLQAQVAAALGTRAGGLSELRRDAHGASRLDLVAPLFFQEAGEARLVGMAALRIDPQRVLSSLVIGTLSRQASIATMLLDRSDGELIRIGEEAADGATRIELPGSDAAETASKGSGATFETVNPAGEPMLAALRPVPGTPWALLVTVARREVLAPMRERAMRALIIVAVVVAFLLAGSAYWWRRRLAEFRTRQKAIDAERADMERHLDSLSRHAIDAVLLIAGDWTISRANDRALELYGLSRLDLLGRNVRDLIDPGSADDLERQMRLVEVQGAVRIETRHRRFDGTMFPVDVSAHTIEVDGRRHCQAIVRDMTDRRRAQEALRASEEKFRAAFFEAPIGTALVDREGRFIDCNTALARMLGRSSEELQRLRFGELLHPDDRTASLVAFGRLVSGERDHNDMDRRYLRGNGEVIHVRYGVSAIRDLSGRFLWAMAIVQDVTAQVLSEQALWASDERFRLALEATDDGIWDWDIQQDSLHVSERWLARLGYGVDEITDMPSTVALVHEEDRPVFLERIQANLEGRSPSFEMEHRLETRQGGWRWVVTRGRIVSRDADGKPLRAVGAQTDVTERKRLQTSLHLADRLATVGTLAAGAAHEINGPLAQVLSRVEFVQAAMAGPGAPGESAAPGAEVGEVRRALDEAREGIGRVASIVQDLKTFSRSDDQRSSVDVWRAVESAIRLAMPAISGRARLSRDFRDTALVAGAEGRLCQVFLSLLVNAGQAICAGPPEQNEVRVRIVATDDQEIRVEIRDTGCGISAEGRARIFDPFFTTKPPGIGTGLGLSICHEFVAAHGGRIEVDSEVGRGSTFSVVLPTLAVGPLRAPASSPGS